MGTKFFSDELPVHKTTVDGWTTNIINGLLGQANGIAPLGVDGLVDPAYLPPTALNTSWGNIGGTITDQADLMTLIGAKAGLASPAFTGTPTAPTAPEGTNNTQIATTEFVNNTMIWKDKYDVIGGVNDNVTFSTSAQAGWTQGAVWGWDGNTLIIVDRTNDRVYQYWVNSGHEYEFPTLSYYSETFYVGAQDVSPVGIRLDPTGTKMYIIGYGSDGVYTYTLSTAWNVTTAVYTSTFYVGGKETSPQDLTFRPDGLKMYIVGTASNKVHQYALTTAWDVSTAVYEASSPSTGLNASYSIEFRPDGLKFWVYHTGTTTLYQYSCGTAWDISTAVADDLGLKTVFGASGGFIFFGKNGTKLYGGGGGNTITQYSIG